jgi:hypothetical protein
MDRLGEEEEILSFIVQTPLIGVLMPDPIVLLFSLAIIVIMITHN